MAPRSRARSRPLAFAGALVRASARASADLVSQAGRSVEKVAAPAARSLVAMGSEVVRNVADADIGLGPARLSPEGVEWARQQVARGLRDLLTADVDGEQLLRASDPTVMARAVLALLGGEERLAPLPSPDEQIRQRFRALLDPDGHDPEGMTPALLAITAQLSPDEARILRYLDGVERVPVLSVMAGSMTRRTGPVVAEHLTMAPERAGADHPERGPEYVGNLLRLGLCAVEDEPPSGHADIDLVTAGAPFQDALRTVRGQGGRPRIHTGSLRLTALGRQLVAIALHGAGSGAETTRALPASPRRDTSPPPPPPEALATR